MFAYGSKSRNNIIFENIFNQTFFVLEKAKCSEISSIWFNKEVFF